MSNATELSPEEISQEDMVIAFMGPTGTGKSTFIDLLTGQEGKRSGKNLESATHQVEATCILHPRSGARIVLVDTPGFDDTYMTELEVLQLIANWLRRMYMLNNKLFGIVYLHRISDRRIRGSTLKNLCMFERLCGDLAMRSVVFTTTMWKDVDLADAEDREAQLISKFWRPMIEIGATVDRLQTTDYAGAWRVIDGLIQRRSESNREAIWLQVELVDLKRKLNETDAGKELYIALQDLLSQVEEQRRSVRAAKKREVDPTVIKELEVELKEIEARLARLKADAAKLKVSFGSRILKLFNSLDSRSQSPARGPTKRVSQVPNHLSTGTITNKPSASGSSSYLRATPNLRDLAAMTTKDVLRYLIEGAAKLDGSIGHEKVQLLVNFLDLVLGEEGLVAPDQRNRIITVLARIAVNIRIYPQRYILKPVEYERESVEEGGFGTVHKALGGTVCVKIMKRIDDEALKSYIKELILWSRLSHPNILPFFGIFLLPSSQRMCLTSPWMANGDLTSYTASISQEDRVPLLIDVIEGLVHLHQLGIVHSDIKGKNVLVSDEGRGLLTDFGVSHIATNTTQQGPTQSVIGSSANFAAPEVIRRKFESSARIRPSKAGDIWSFGSLCYEILTRKIPFGGLTDSRIYFLLCNEQRLPERPGIEQDDDENGDKDGDDDEDDDFEEIVEDNFEEVSDDMWELITGCWVFDPNQRPNGMKTREMTACLMKKQDKSFTPKHVKKPRGIVIASEPAVDFHRVQQILANIQAEIPTSPRCEPSK